MIEMIELKQWQVTAASLQFFFVAAALLFRFRWFVWFADVIRVDEFSTETSRM